MTIHFIRSLGALAVMALLAGCGGLSTLNSASRPTDLYLLTPKSTFASSLPRVKHQIVVSEPTATAAVATDRITVQPTPLQVEYLPRARWVDRAPVIIQTLLIESFENSGKVDAVGRSSVDLRADYVIVTDVREFQARVPTNADPTSPLEVHVRLNLKIVDAGFDRIIASKSFEKVVATTDDAAPDIIAAFDKALGNVMRNAIEWSLRKIATDAASQPSDPSL
jgi:cholesterol transport system auxiliary component